ncbi:MAG: hypothetical protein N2Z80_02915 [Hydrogenothermaceae bacterium]|nr:hypothetical protein [Hydrogenothermaceae bacterium]
MDRTPYAEEFLIHQLEIVISNIRKPSYREEIQKLMNNREWFGIFKRAKDRKLRNYTGGILERTASIGALSLCLYDNYPMIEIDLILSGVVVAGFRDSVGKKQIYDNLSNSELKSVAFKKSRKKPKLEYFLFDELFKIDIKVVSNRKKHNIIS